jgi:hypothetical protein
VQYLLNSFCKSYPSDLCEPCLSNYLQCPLVKTYTNLCKAKPQTTECFGIYHGICEGTQPLADTVVCGGTQNITFSLTIGSTSSSPPSLPSPIPSPTPLPLKKPAVPVKPKPLTNQVNNMKQLYSIFTFMYSLGTN